MKVNPHVNTTSPTVEIFKTNVNNQQLANKIVANLKQIYPEYHINFDLEDCDNILRIESCNKIDVFKIMDYSKNYGILTEVINY